MALGYFNLREHPIFFWLSDKGPMDKGARPASKRGEHGQRGRLARQYARGHGAGGAGPRDDHGANDGEDEEAAMEPDGKKNAQPGIPTRRRKKKKNCGWGWACCRVVSDI